MKDDKWLYFWIYYVQGSIGIVSELKKLIVYFHNHVPEPLHECLYIPVVVGWVEVILGVRWQILAHGCLECLCLPSTLIPKSVSARIRKWTLHRFGSPWKMFATYHYRREDVMSLKKQQNKNKAKIMLLPYSSALSYSTWLNANLYFDSLSLRIFI